MIDLRNEPGWAGSFSRGEAPGCFRNGTRVRKCKTDASDTHPIGTMATVLGSLKHPQLGAIYFVEWDPLPKCAVVCIDWKLEAV